MEVRRFGKEDVGSIPGVKLWKESDVVSCIGSIIQRGRTKVEITAAQSNF